MRIQELVGKNIDTVGHHRNDDWKTRLPNVTNVLPKAHVFDYASCWSLFVLCILTIVLLKESINSDGQQFHQYQQNELDMSARYQRHGQQFHQYQ